MMNRSAQQLYPLIVKKTGVDLPSGNNIYRARIGDSSLTFFGTRHSYDPQHGQFPQLVKAFDEATPDCVLSEGLHQFRAHLSVNEFLDLKSRMTHYAADEAIRRGAETLFVARLALLSEAYLYSPEPTFESFLAGINQRRQTSAAELLSVILVEERYLWFRRNNGQSWSDVQALLRAEFIKETHCRSDDVDDEAISCVFRQNFRKLLEDLTPGEIRAIIPPRAKSPFAPIINGMSEFRDEYLLDAIVNALCERKRVFVSYGVSHLDRLLPALRALEGSKDESLESFGDMASREG